jgi:ArsR family metal-binding transcriptional regulator
MNGGDADELITDYRFELVEDHHSAGSGRYGVRVLLPADISACFPYLNTVLDDPVYDHENGILIGSEGRGRYAFRPHEIQAGMVADSAEAPPLAEAVVRLVNRVWRERDGIRPSLRERKLPTVYGVYKLLPGTNCRECGYPTCLACAADMRNKAVPPEKCPPLSRPEYADNRAQILELFSSD